MASQTTESKTCEVEGVPPGGKKHRQVGGVNMFDGKLELNSNHGFSRICMDLLLKGGRFPYMTCFLI